MVAGLVMMVAEELAEALDLVPGERVLDVACGSGNGAIAAARRPGATSSESTSSRRCSSAGGSGRRRNVSTSSSSRATRPRSLRGRRVRRRDVDLRRDVRRRPGEGGGGAAARCKPGGRIGMANWVPDGGVGRMFMTIAKHAPPPPGRQPAAALGHRGAAARAVRRRGLRAAHRASQGRVRHSGRRITSSTSFAPTSARPRSPSSGSDRRARRRWNADLRAYLEEQHAGDRALVLEPEYLQVSGDAGLSLPRPDAPDQALGLKTRIEAPISSTPRKMRPATAPPWPSQA